MEVKATEAKSTAEEKFEKKDYNGARLAALHAQSLYPDLIGIAHMVTMLQVYVSAENKINGEVNWYDVLGINPYVDDEAIKKRYRKLALMLHPDKNKCVGAKGAFNLITEAKVLLTDKEKRLRYDIRMGYNVFQQNIGTHNGIPVPFWSQHHVHTYMGTPLWRGQHNVQTHMCSPSTSWPSQQNERAGSTTIFSLFGQKIPISTSVSDFTGGGPSTPSPAHANGPSVPSNKETSSPKPQDISAMMPRKKTPDTFWTACPQCKRKYEHDKTFYNSTILCHICQEPFLASETVPPVKFVKTKLFGRRTSVSTC